ncbi:hypothetical protein L2E82_13335 [Cichorium intybus]|uniref:Uncharacterized protein n=1 Tax=Cichorium intybus TaxID=13427 RepID=A0ACB9EXA3_CICIN|nr:hypothetical protein L2E82_13335 [Cichorium intybus]
MEENEQELNTSITAGEELYLNEAPTKISGLKLVSFSNSERTNLPLSFCRLPNQKHGKKLCDIVRKQLALKDDISVDIVMGLEEAFGITLEEESAQSFATVQDAAHLIEKLCEKSA